MGGALIQLIAYGLDNIYLTSDPQITFFKIMYRRHTNFSSEPIQQQFINQPDFGKISTCVISKNADLAGHVYIVVTLPNINISNDPLLKFAWVKRIGFALVKTIEIEINGRIIDRHYGEWLNLWSEITGQINGEQQNGYNTMIGNVPELTTFTSTKNAYTLYIPLYFWFCRNSGSVLPLVSLQYSDIKINVEFEDALNCFLLSPTHYIKCRDDIVGFEQYEYIEQNINGTINAGLFTNFDTATKRLYYTKLTPGKLTSIPAISTFDPSSANQSNIDTILNSPNGLQHSIVGQTSGFSTFAEFNNFSVSYTTINILSKMSLVSSYLLVEYFFLDNDERTKFAQSKHDYIIEQLFFTPNIKIEDPVYGAKIIVENPCKLMVWVTQLASVRSSKDYFNYTDSYINISYEKNKAIGKNIITKETITFNGIDRLSLRNSFYFDSLQKHLHTKTTTIPGINMYSFGLYPFMVQPSGTCNMSLIDNIQIQMKLVSDINPNNIVFFRAYCICYGILRVVDGLIGLVFIK